MLDWRALPLRLAATLAAGLPMESRSIRKAAGRTVAFDETELLAYAADRLTQVVWWLNSDTSKPPSLVADLNGLTDGGSDSNVLSFDSPEEFDAALAALKGG